MTDHFSYIKGAGATLQVGETTNVPCCFCGTEKTKLSITRIDEGLLYNCWLPHCSGRGFIGTLPSTLLVNEDKKRERFTPKPYHYPTQQLSLNNKNHLIVKYDFPRTDFISGTLNTWRKRELDLDDYRGQIELVMPLLNSSGYSYGKTTKYWGQADRKKSIHYLETPSPMLHYASMGKECGVIVEGVLDAVKVSSLNLSMDGIALLGTEMNDEKAKDIASQKYDAVIFALDPDASEKARDMARHYGLLFKNCHVAYLPKDPKDLPFGKLNRYLWNLKGK